MPKSERWSTGKEIKKSFYNIKDKRGGAGPNIYYDDYSGAYCHDGEGHVLFIGSTGKGKTTAGSLAYGRNVLDKGENEVIVDPKGEMSKKLAGYAKSLGYRVELIDLRHPYYSLTKVNILKYPYKLIKSGDPEKEEQGINLIYSIAEALKKEDKDDPFWSSQGEDVIVGTILALFALAKDEDEVNISSVANMINHYGDRIGTQLLVKEFINCLSDYSEITEKLHGFADCANDTRNSIYVVSKDSLSATSKSKSLTNFLSQDTLDINTLDIEDRPIAIFIIIPLEVNTYDEIAGIICQQLILKFTYLAQEKYNDRLPTRMHIILEELGNIGKAIDLAHACSSARSLGIRIAAVLQDYNQLNKIYGDSDAATIKSSFDVIVCFSSNSWDTLLEWQNFCGETVKIHKGIIERSPLISAYDLAKMPPCKALVMIEKRYKVIVKFPYYDDLYETKNFHEPSLRTEYTDNKPKIFDIVKFVKNAKEKERSEMMDKHHDFNPFATHNPFASPIEHNDSVKTEDILEMDFDKLMKELDEEIAKREKEEKEENNE